MKSIKEKAEEYSEEHGFRVPYDGSNNFYDEVDVKASEEGFIKGANYVLECFESILPFVAKKGVIYGKIKETIEQLKK